jgi:hypothetical protein
MAVSAKPHEVELYRIDIVLLSSLPLDIDFTDPWLRETPTMALHDAMEMKLKM